MGHIVPQPWYYGTGRRKLDNETGQSESVIAAQQLPQHQVRRTPWSAVKGRIRKWEQTRDIGIALRSPAADVGKLSVLPRERKTDEPSCQTAQSASPRTFDIVQAGGTGASCGGGARSECRGAKYARSS